ncbi:hypothetical protein PG997_008912 [Apiospora hydei]|uniref:DNA mismatch repair protein HSM3 N-terminal domain-containing protein n=1 Tax=Apiospora hydei TaxID=1337664 RepID=A0ABR1WFZ8_9PEZI
MDTDTVPVTGVDELDAHLDELIANPAMKPTVKLFDDVELQLNETNIPPLIPRLLPKITEILKQYQQDPAVLCSLAVKLLGPVSFTQVLSMASEEALIQALRSPAPSANLLAMAILEKAARSPADAAILAMMNNIISAFITTWLSAPQVGVGEKGTKVLGDLLDTDCDAPPLSHGVQSSTTLNGMEIAVRNKPPGQGLMWRRIFHDRDIYALVLSPGQPGRAPERRGRPGRAAADPGPRPAPPPDAPSRRPEPGRHQPHRLPGSQRTLRLGCFRRPRSSSLCDPAHGGQGGPAHAPEPHRLLRGVRQPPAHHPYSTFKMDTLRKLMKDALKGDDRLRSAMIDLPNRTVPEEAEELRRFVREIMQL